MNAGTMSDFAKKVFDKVKYLIIDEYQDTNPSQEYLAELFHKYGHANLCVVGDADQTIYQFRGSDESNILGFEGKYNAEKKDLNLDFRSTEGIIDIASKSIIKNHTEDNNYMGFSRGVIPGASLEYEEGDAVYKGFEEFDDEAEFIASRIKELHEKGVPLSEIAVLFRNRQRKEYGQLLADLQEVISEKLKQKGIMCITEGLNNLSKTAEFKACLETFRYMDKRFRATYDPEEKFLDGVAKYWEEYDRKTVHPPTDPEEKLIFYWKKVAEAYDTEGLVVGIESAVSDLKKLKYSSYKYGHELNMQQVYQEFIGKLSVINDDSSAAQSLMYNLGKFSKVIADFELLFFRDPPSFKVSRFISHLYKIVPELYPEGEADNAYIRGDAVRLMTIHQSKGLEFTAVFIPALVQAMFPGTWDGRGYGNVYGPMDALEEAAGEDAANWLPNYNSYRRPKSDSPHFNDAERKLFYVAVTRAKKYLYLTYTESYGSIVDWNGNEKVVQEEESVFLDEVKESEYMKEYDAKYKLTTQHLPEFSDDPIPITLNFSLLSNYYDCPYRFKLSNFYGFVQPYTQSQGYGTVLHEIMMHIHNAWIEGKKLSDKEIDAIAEESMNLPFASDLILRNSLQSAKRCAHAYVAQNEKDADKIVASELEINIEMGDGVSVNGRIDLVRKVDDNGALKTAIVDLKSAGKDAEQCLNAEQLKIYAIGYATMTGENADYLSIYNLDYPDGSRNATEAVDKEVLIEMKKSIKESANCIRKSDLPRCVSDKCETCYVKGLCRK